MAQSLWAQYQAGIVKARKPEQRRRLPTTRTISRCRQGASRRPRGSRARQEAGDAPQVAPRVRRRAEEAIVGEDEKEHTYPRHPALELSRQRAPTHALHLDGDRIGVVVASGEILDGEQPPGTVGSDSLARLLRDALHDDAIKAVVLRIDSPGGSMFASEVIRREIDALRDAGKPVVASMSSVAASGGYYIAMDANEIWASPATLTGSIGVFAVFPTFERTLGKFGMHDRRRRHDAARGLVAAGSLAARSAQGSAADVGRARVQRLRRQRRDGAQEVVRRHRRQSRRAACGPGIDASQHGLVDHLGSYKDAINAAAKLAKLGDDYKVEYIEPPIRLARRRSRCSRRRLAARLRARGRAGAPAVRRGAALVRAAGRRARAAVAVHAIRAGVLLLPVRGETDATFSLPVQHDLARLALLPMISNPSLVLREGKRCVITGGCPARSAASRPSCTRSRTSRGRRCP